jgi:hypothetical protein
MQLRLGHSLASFKRDCAIIFYPVRVEFDEVHPAFEARLSKFLGNDPSVFYKNVASLSFVSKTIEDIITGTKGETSWISSTQIINVEARKRFFADPTNPMWETLHSEKSNDLPTLYGILEAIAMGMSMIVLAIQQEKDAERPEAH